MSRICLCGSYDDRKKIYEIGRLLIKDYEVFIPAFYLGKRPNREEQNNLMQAHFKRIVISDKILFIFNSKIGVNTLIELGYAEAFKKEIYLLVNELLDYPDEFENFTNFKLVALSKEKFIRMKF